MNTLFWIVAVFLVMVCLQCVSVMLHRRTEMWREEEKTLK